MENNKINFNNVNVTKILSKKNRPESSFLNFDFIDIFEILYEKVKTLYWVAIGMDYDGIDVPEYCLLSCDDLIGYFKTCQQTIDGMVLGFKYCDIYSSNINPEYAELNLLKFPDSNCQIAIRAVDSTFFEVYSKNSNIPDLLSSHFCISKENPLMYF